MDVETAALFKKLRERNLLNDEWDKQMKRDIKAGRMDALIEEVIRERDAGETEPM